MKKITFLFMAGMLSGLLCSCGSSNNDRSKFLQFEKTDGGYLVSGYTRSNMFDPNRLSTVTVPAMHENLPVIGVKANAFKDAADLGEVKFEENEVSKNTFTVGKNAFYQTYNLKKITFPKGLKIIPENCFYHSGFESLSLKDVGIQKSAFSNCENLKKAKFVNVSFEELVFEGCLNLEEVSVDNELIKNPTNPSQSLPHMLNLGKRAFYGCRKLKKANIKGITHVGEAVFDNCWELKEITVSNYLRQVHEQAFTCTYSNHEITTKYETLPGNIGVIFSFTNECLVDESTKVLYKGNANGNIPSEVVRIADEAFYNSSLTSLTLPSTVTAIGNRSFQYCTRLVTVDFGDSLSSIDFYAFDNCSSLTSVTLPDSIYSIESSAFCCCKNMNYFMLGRHIDHVGSGAFDNTHSLNEIHFNGTKSQWFENNVHNISRNSYETDEHGENYNFEVLGNIDIVCTDGTIEF